MEQRDKDRLLSNLTSLPNELEDLLKDLDEETLRWRPIPNKWSIKEIMCHLRDMERLGYLARYRRMLMEDNPFLPNVDQDRMASEGDYLNQDTNAALEEFKWLRKETINILQWTPTEYFSRTGTHETDGPNGLSSISIRR